MPFRFDPDAIELKVGLEIHQQLATRSKLFCACPIRKSENLPRSFERRLRPTQSELGHIDPAALFEFTKGKSSVYNWNEESSCLVEADEEPPHEINADALDTAILISQLLRSSIVDEIHVMRKVVIDGSNTSGFQRTATIGLDGEFVVDGEAVGVQSVNLEEDAARILKEDDGARYFALDRQGVPLVEVALDPLVGPPDYIEGMALGLGRALRSTGRVARGLGTIRQDLNVSVLGGSIVEVKGVQKLNLLAKVVTYEATRQMGLVKIAQETKGRGLTRIECRRGDVTAIVKRGRSDVLSRASISGIVVCVAATGLAGLLGAEPYPGIRLGKELAEIARANSLGGVIHSDEFAAQGVSKDEENAMRGSLGVDEKAALVLVAGERSRVETVSQLVAARLAQAIAGVPAETRAATDDGATRYMRPRPGPARMYPETDIPETVIGESRKKLLFEAMPMLWEEKVRSYERKYNLSGELALRVYDSDYASTFEELTGKLRLEPSVIAALLVEMPTRLSREGIDEAKIRPDMMAGLLSAIDEGKVAKEAAVDVLRLIGRGETESIDESIARLGLRPIARGDLDELIGQTIAANRALILSKGAGAFAALMGEVMKEVRGRADGEVVSTLLREHLKKFGSEKGKE